MRILVDENIPLMTVNELCRLGHEVEDFRRTEREGQSDEEIWQIAIREKRLLISTDRSFLKHRNFRHSGLLIVLLRQPNRFRIHERVIQAFQEFGSEDWPGLSVVMRDRVQTRLKKE